MTRPLLGAHHVNNCLAGHEFKHSIAGNHQKGCGGSELADNHLRLSKHANGLGSCSIAWRVWVTDNLRAHLAAAPCWEQQT